jgi:pimeloyl-ACP methyl ester carboxylesterase
MRRSGLACTAAIVALALAVGPVHAQSTAPSFEKEPFSGSDLLNGKKITQAECEALPSAVWVVAEGQRECIRYFHSAAGGSGSEVIVSFPQDMVSTNGRGEVKPHDYYVKATPAQVQDLAVSWSRNLGLPYLRLGRPGTYGSSGEHGKRRTAGEIAIISAALDAIKVRHGYTRIHLVGWSTGGHSAAALMARRTDLGCVVLSSALLSVRSYLAEFGRSEDWTGNKNPIDPIALVDRITARPDLRIFVLTDPDDAVISARSQTVYVKRLAAAKLPVRQIFVAAPDTSAHQLDSQARQVLAACAKGTADDAIVAKFQNKAPETPPDADDPPLHKPEMLSQGVNINEAGCKSIVTALWVKVQGRGYCVRYWMSAAGGKKDEALIYIHGDIGSVENGKPKFVEGIERVTAGQLRRDAQRWSRIYGGPYMAIGRVGAYGSSGNHRDRKNLLEVRVVMAALDALKQEHNIKRFHLVGQSGGGHTVAALVQRRTDIGCAVMASAAVSVKSGVRDRGKPITPNIKALYDPIDLVGSMEHQQGRRMIVLSDPEDRIVSYRSQREFAERVKQKGLPILQVTASAGDKNFHGLTTQGKNIAIDCAKGTDDQALVTRYQTKPAPQRAEGEARASGANGRRTR